MNSAFRRLAFTITCFIFITGQFILTGHIYAQGHITIRGMVLDAKNKSSIPNAKIKLTGNKLTVADLSGKFEFRCLREDSFMVSAVGYSPRMLNVVDLVADSSSCNVYMQPLFHQLRSVEVVAEKKKKPTKVMKVLNKMAELSHPFNYFSDDEILKRRHMKIKAKSIYFSQNIYWQINRKLITDLSKLSGSELDKCIIYCNTHIALSADDDELAITNKLLLLISDYFKSTKSETRDSTNVKG